MKARQQTCQVNICLFTSFIYASGVLVIYDLVVPLICMVAMVQTHLHACTAHTYMYMTCLYDNILIHTHMHTNTPAHTHMHTHTCTHTHTHTCTHTANLPSRNASETKGEDNRLYAREGQQSLAGSSEGGSCSNGCPARLEPCSRPHDQSGQSPRLLAT